MTLNEAQTRKQLIDTKLALAGWNVKRGLDRVSLFQRKLGDKR